MRYINVMKFSKWSQDLQSSEPANTYSKLATETLEQGVKYAQS